MTPKVDLWSLQTCTHTYMSAYTYASTCSPASLGVLVCSSTLCSASLWKLPHTGLQCNTSQMPPGPTKESGRSTATTHQACFWSPTTASPGPPQHSELLKDIKQNTQQTLCNTGARNEHRIQHLEAKWRARPERESLGLLCAVPRVF